MYNLTAIYSETMLMQPPKRLNQLMRFCYIATSNIWDLVDIHGYHNKVVLLIRQLLSEILLYRLYQEYTIYTRESVELQIPL